MRGGFSSGGQDKMSERVQLRFELVDQRFHGCDIGFGDKRQLFIVLYVGDFGAGDNQ